jgi:hypothetical protein
MNSVIITPYALFSKIFEMAFKMRNELRVPPVTFVEYDSITRTYATVLYSLYGSG